MGAGGGGGREECHAGRTMHRALWYAAMEADGHPLPQHVETRTTGQSNQVAKKLVRGVLPVLGLQASLRLSQLDPDDCCRPRLPERPRSSHARHAAFIVSPLSPENPIF